MPMTLSLLALVVIVALVAGGIRYVHLARKNRPDSRVGSGPGTLALRTLGWTLGLGVLLGAAFIGWVVYMMSPAA